MIEDLTEHTLAGIFGVQVGKIDPGVPAGHGLVKQCHTSGEAPSET